MSGQVIAGILFFKHGKRNNLRIAQVPVLVGIKNTFRQMLGISCSGVNIFALFGYNNGGSGVLAGGQLAFGRNNLVHEHGMGHKAIIVRCLLICQNMLQFFEVRGAQEKRNICKCFPGKEFQAGWIDFQNFPAINFNSRYIVGG